MTARVTMDRWHRYAIDGEWVPGVTSVIGVLDKPALVGWAANEAAAYAATHLDEVEVRGVDAWIKDVAGASRRAGAAGAKRGKDLHKLSESLVYGNPLPDTDEKGDPWDAEVYAMAGQLARWFDAFEVEPVIHEAIVFNEDDRWCGTLDLIGDLNDRHRWLLDYKTTQSGVWPENALQLAAYRHATHVQVGDHVQLMPDVDGAGVVWIRPDRFELVPVTTDRWVYDAFRACLPLWAWTKVDRDALILPPVIPPAREEEAVSS